MAIEERKSQLEFEVVDNTKPGIESIKDGLQGVNTAAADAANKASRSLDDVAQAGKDAGQQLERATASIASSIKRVTSDTQRQIATLKAEASGGGSADIFENLISQRGANANALKPLIDNLRVLRGELDTLRQVEQRRSVDVNYERERQAAEQARRRADATAALTQVLEQQEAAERRLAGQNSFVSSLRAQSEAIGKTKADLLEMQAAQMGVSSQAAPYIARLREQEQALQRGGTALSAYGMSAKQTTAALRQVPAQITDIVVSLQGGQAPLTVLLQQGGQLKDVFGGVAPALRGLAAGVAALITPTSLAVAGVGALALAYYQGSQEADAYNKAIVLTGNRAGVTAGQLQASAKAIGDSVGTQREAAAALAELASTGQVAGQNMQRFGEVAVRANRDLGISVSAAAKDFAALGEAPVEASLKLTKQYGYLTLATLEQIKALQDQGRTQEAATLAQETYANAMVTKSDQMVERLGYVERAWRKVRDEAKGAWDEILNVGRPSTMEDRLTRLRNQIETKKSGLDSYKDTGAGRIVAAEVAALEEQAKGLEDLITNQRKSAEMQRTQIKQQDEAAAAFEKVTKAQEKGLTKQEQLNKALVEYNRELEKIQKSDPNSPLLSQEARARGEKAIRDQFKETTTGTRGQEGRQSELADLDAKIKATQEYTQRLREQGIEADKVSEGTRMSDSIQQQLNGTLSASTRAFLEQKLARAKLLEQAQLEQSAETEIQKTIAKRTEEEKKLVASITEEVKSTEQRRMKLDETTEAYGRNAIAVAKLAEEQTRLRLIEAEEPNSGVSPERIAELRKLLAEQRKLVGSTMVAEYEKVNRAIGEQITQAEELNALQQFEVSLIGLSEVERKKIVAAREVELKLAKELREIEKLGLGEDETNTLKAQKEAEYRVKAVNASNKVILDDWQKTTDEINRSLTDALLRGFESGKGFAENLRDTLKNMFNTLVLRPIISAVISPISGAISTLVSGIMGGGGGGGSNILGLASNAGTAYNAYNGFTTGTGIYGRIGSALGFGASASPYAYTAVGSYAAPTGTAMLNAPTLGGGAPSVFANPMLGVYAAVAAVLANAFGAFRERKQVDSGLVGTLGKGDLESYALWRESGTLFGGPDYDMMRPAQLLRQKEEELVRLRQSGGEASTIYTVEQEIKALKEMYGEAIESTRLQSDAIQTAYGKLRDNVGDMADILGISSTAVREFTMQLDAGVINGDTGERGLQLGGLKPEEVQAKVNEALATANNTLAEQVIGSWVPFTETIVRTVDNIVGTGENAEHVFDTITETTTGMRYVASEYARDGEKAIDTLTRLASSLKTVNQIWDTLGFTLLDASLAGGDFASSLVDAFGGLEAMVAKFDSYYQNFYTEQERRDTARRQLRPQLEELGLGDVNFDDPGARDRYRAAVQAAVERASAQDANRRALSASIANLGMTGVTSGSLGDVLRGVTGAGEATPEALAGLASAINDLGASATGLDDFKQSISEYVEANAEALGIEDDAAETVAALLGLSDAFAAVTESAEENAARQRDIADRRFDLEVRLAEAEGRSRDAIDMRRAKENAALMALDPELAKLAYRLWLLEDAAQAAADAEAKRVAAIDKGMANLQAAYAREQKVLEARLDGLSQYRKDLEGQQSKANESLNLISGVFTLLESSVKDLYASVESSANAQAEQGRAFIAQSLTDALTKGVLPDQGDLSDAIRAARAGIDSGVYGNSADKDFAKLVLAGQLRALEEVAGDQKTDAEKQLDALKKQLDAVDSQTEAIQKQIQLQQDSLDYFREQIDIANGVYDATISVEQAVRDLTTLLGGEVIDNPLQPAPGGGGGGGSGTGGPVFGGGGSASQPPAKYSRLVYGGTAGVGYEAIRDQSLIDRLDMLSPVYHAFDGTGDLAGLAAAFKGAGGTIADLSILSGNWASDWRNAFANVGIPAFAVGTNRVPKDMIAQIHKDEAIVPKAFNPWAGGSGMGASTERLERLVEQLVAKVAELSAAAEDTANSANTTAMVLSRVTNNGNAMVTEMAPEV